MRRNSVRLCNRAQSHLRALGVKVDLVPEGHFAQARAVQVKDRIREGGGRRGRAGFADATDRTLATTRTYYSKAIAKLRTDPDLRAVHFDDPDLSLDSDEGSLEG